MTDWLLEYFHTYAPEEHRHSAYWYPTACEQHKWSHSWILKSCEEKWDEEIGLYFEDSLQSPTPLLEVPAKSQEPGSVPPWDLTVPPSSHSPGTSLK